MSALHPEDLLDEEAHGNLSGEQCRLLDEHCRACSACALQRCGGAVAPAQMSDRALIARVAQAASAAPAGKGARRRTRYLAAGIVCAVALGGVAVAMVGWQRPLAVPALHRALPTPVPPGAVPPAPAPPPPMATIGPSAPALFARANQARRMGAVPEALRMYRELQRSHPHADEARLSHVIMGRVLLDRMADPRGALLAFDRYLRAGARGPLREEALVGRALALGRLSDAGGERRAWQALLAAYPDSMYSERARARLVDLDAPR